MISILKKWVDQIFAEEEALLLLLLIAAALVVVITMGHVLAPVITSIILAFMMQGVILRLRQYNVPHWLAVLSAFMVFIGSFFILLLVVVPMAWQQMSNLFNELPRMLAQGQELLMLLPERYPNLISEGQIQEWVGLVKAEAGEVGQWVLSFSLSTIPNLLAILIYLILVPILVFFFLKDRDTLLSYFGSFLPLKRPILNSVWLEMNQQIANYLRGKAIEILVVGGVSYIAFLILGLNYAALLALLVGLSVLIPYIGATVVTVPVLMIGYFQWGSGSEFIMLAVVYGVIQMLDGNVLVPLLFSEAVNLHPVAIIMAVLVFGGIWGLWGVFFAIPLATLIKAVLNAWPSAAQAS
jgi:putative permease